MSIVVQGSRVTISYACDQQGRYPAMEFLDGLKADPARERDHASVMHLLKMYADQGCISNDQKFKVIEGTDPALVEFKKHQVRVLGFFAGPGRLVLTHGCIKKKDKLDKSELDRAYRIRAEHLSTLGRRIP